MNSKGWWKHVLGYLAILAPWIILLTQAQWNWLEFANVQSARYFGIGMVVLATIGVMALTSGIGNQVKFGMIALITQFGLLFLGGNFGIVDAVSPDYVSGQGIWYSLDGLSGLSSAIGAMEGVVGIVAKAIPFFVLIVGVTGILVADSPDEYMTPVIETVIAVAILCLFYGLGNWIGFV